MNREETLKYEFNNFLSSKLSLEVNDYYNELNTNDFIELKSLLRNINNIITLRLTLKFIDTLVSLFKLSKENKSDIINRIQAINPNTNGFDILIQAPIKIVAEVKGNIPINNGSTFGSAQQTGILNDISSLINGKRKSDINPYDFYKFMVLPDTKTTREATIDLLKKKLKDYHFEILDNSTKDLKIDTIYIAFVILN